MTNSLRHSPWVGNLIRNKSDGMKAVGIPFKSDIAIEEVRRQLDFDAETGFLIWRKTGRPGVRFGTRAGSVETRKGKPYRFIRLNGGDYLAQRLAWFHFYGEWPKRILRFADGNSDNCKIANLIETQEFDRAQNERKKRKENPTYFRGADIKRTFGITLETYQRIFVAQGGVCAICKNPEKDKRNGRVKWLAIDHCHERSVVRGLLCFACNSTLGRMGENPARLRAAADYLEMAKAVAPENVIYLVKRGTV